MIREINYDEVFDAQLHFRMILDAMSRPGKISQLNHNVTPPNGINQASILIGLALLNTDVSFKVLNKNNREIEDYIAINTQSQITDIGEADYIFMQGDESDAVLNAKTGSLIYPENSATLIIDVQEIYDHELEDSLKIVLKGPGVNGTANVYVRGLAPAVLENLKIQNAEFPIGVDVILSDNNNRIIGIPRSNKFISNTISSLVQVS